LDVTYRFCGCGGRFNVRYPANCPTPLWATAALPELPLRTGRDFDVCLAHLAELTVTFYVPATGPDTRVRLTPNCTCVGTSYPGGLRILWVVDLLPHATPQPGPSSTPLPTVGICLLIHHGLTLVAWRMIFPTHKPPHPFPGGWRVPAPPHPPHTTPHTVAHTVRTPAHAAQHTARAHYLPPHTYVRARLLPTGPDPHYVLPHHPPTCPMRFYTWTTHTVLLYPYRRYTTTPWFLFLTIRGYILPYAYALHWFDSGGRWLCHGPS